MESKKNISRRTFFKTLGAATAATALLAACSTPDRRVESTALHHIAVDTAMEHPGTLHLSDLGQRVRYIVLETNDSCLIGNNPTLMVLDKHLLVSSNNRFYSFDKETGRFVSQIGHIGADPQGYTQDGMPSYNKQNGLLYFKRQPDQLQKYDLQGHYRGRTYVPASPAMPVDYGFIDTLLVGYSNSLIQRANKTTTPLTFFTESDTAIVAGSSRQSSTLQLSPAGIEAITSRTLGNMRTLIIRYEDGSAIASAAATSPLWSYADSLRFKDMGNDTIYHVAPTGKLSPYAIFETGEWHYTPETFRQTEKSDERLLPSYVAENEHTFFFQCIQGLYEEKPEIWNGVYNKHTRVTRMRKEADGFADDVNGFMPFHPSACGTAGEYAQIVEAVDVLTWLDEHPEAKQNEAFAPLIRMSEDDNPVVILVD